MQAAKRNLSGPISSTYIITKAHLLCGMQAGAQLSGRSDESIPRPKWLHETKAQAKEPESIDT